MDNNTTAANRAKRNNKKIVFWTIGAVLAAILIISNGVFAGWVVYKLNNRQNVSQTNVPDGNLRLTDEEIDTSKIVAKVSPSVVSIITTQGSYLTRAQQGAGTGIIISPDGYILTNNHVVDGADSVRIITNDGNQHTDVSIVGRDPLNDIAFLKIKDAKNLPAAELGNSSTVKVGQKVIAIGNSLGRYQNSVTSGIISGKGRPVAASSDDRKTKVEELTDLLQTDAAVNLGNSGGPLINLSGQVIGINTATVSDAQSMGFAIPINAAKGMSKSVLQGKGVQKAYIGVRYVAVTPEVRAEYNLPVKSGAYIGGHSGGVVETGGPADTAGIKEGDVITKINNKNVGEDGGLSTLVSEYLPGEKIEVTLVRAGKNITVDLTLAAYKS